MKVNVGSTDRMLRFGLGALLIVVALVLSGGDGLRWIMGLVGLVLVGTAGMRFCPLYRLIGMNTCKG